MLGSRLLQSRLPQSRRLQSWILACALLGAACTPGASPRAAQSGVRAPDSAEPGARVRPSRTPSGRQGAILRAHNVRRAKHCAQALRWSNELARTAQGWADKLARGRCALEHSDTPFGENLAAGTSGAFSPEDIVQMWFREREQYRFARGSFSLKTGHFTQLVWRSTRMIGCGMSECKGMDVWVCHYDPPGNVEGRFDEQVLPTSCQK